MSSDDFNQTDARSWRRRVFSRQSCWLQLPLTLLKPADSLTSWQLHVHLRVSKTSWILLVSSKSTAVLQFLQSFWEQMALFFEGSFTETFFFPALSSPCASETNLAAEPPAVRDVLRVALPPHVFLLLLL